jgi:phosphatidylglycerol---prolipoprotein diacylglyceryl transferase
MRSTLFYIPHDLLGIPVFGLGWAFALLLVGVIGYVLRRRKQTTIADIIAEQGMFFGIAAVVIVFLVPRIESRFQDAAGLEWIAGLPIRGYGVMLMLGVISAVAIALNRSRRNGLTNEQFYSLATWVVVSGVLGARLFYVVQKWEELEGATLFAKLWTALKFTEGGLVVYGSVIGGLIAILIWTWKNRVPLIPIADAVTPAFFIGLAFGRIGCLLNGCCYGGICESGMPSISFPSGSPAYVDQLHSGRLLGILTDQAEGASGSSSSNTVRSVRVGSWAESQIKVGQQLSSVQEMYADGPTRQNPNANVRFDAVVNVDGRRLQVAMTEMPERALPVHPSQIYAACSGLLLCAWTFLLSESTKRAGIVFGSGLIAYGFLRIIEEIIRVDEAGQFGTSLSIAQWISIGAILLGGLILVRGCMHNHNDVQQPAKAV